MFTDFGKKPLLTNLLPWQQGNVYFRFLKLKTLLIPSYEKSSNLVVIDPKLKKLSTSKQNLRGKHLPPVLIGLNKPTVGCQRVVGKRLSIQNNRVSMDENRKSGFYPNEPII